MKRLLTAEQMRDMLAVSRSRYYEMLNPKSQWYDPNLPKPVFPYGDTKQRFYSVDVENYIEHKLNQAA